MDDAISVIDGRHILAAEGWLELGNYSEAKEELDEVSSPNLGHPDVLTVRWEIFSRARQWKACEDVARALTAFRPEEARGWNQLAHSLHKQRRTQEAYDTLSTVAEVFPTSSSLFYNLAVYGCSLGRLDEAELWLERACETSGQARQLKILAREDPALRNLWPAPGNK
jgi:tetratricopeptide (TPR) repeat protein